MSRTASVRQAVVPSCSLLPLEHPALSIVTMCSFSREFFNTIDPKLSFGQRQRREFSRPQRSSGARRASVLEHAVWCPPVDPLGHHAEHLAEIQSHCCVFGTAVPSRLSDTVAP